MSSERELQAYYDNEAAAGARAAMGSRGRRDELRAVFVAQLVAEERSSVIEVGAGPGTDAAAFLDAGIGYTGFDLAVGNCRAAQQAGLRIVPGSLFAPPFRPGSFDAGWTMSTLLHDVRFPRQGDAVGDRPTLEPTVSDGKRHEFTVLRRGAGRVRRVRSRRATTA